MGAQHELAAYLQESSKRTFRLVPHSLPFKLSPTVNMSGSDDNGSPGAQEKPEAGASEHLNIKVTDNNNEVFFKIKRTTQLKKLMDAFCERQGKAPNSVRFLFDGS